MKPVAEWPRYQFRTDPERSKGVAIEARHNGQIFRNALKPDNTETRMTLVRWLAGRIDLADSPKDDYLDPQGQEA